MSERGKIDKEHHKNIRDRGGDIQKVKDIEDSLNVEKTKIPKDTKKILSDFKNVDNFNLKFNKLARFEKNKFKFFETDRRGVKYQIKANFSDNFINNVARQYYGSIKRLNLEFSEDLVLKPEWRMAIGLGNESVYETSMTLHHIYGIPYIPGSAIKGVVRSHIITELFGVDENDSLDLKNAENKALQDQGFCDIFGCPQKSFYNESRQGKLIFFDAFPQSDPQMKPDVMNPHYGPYYSDPSVNTPPADYHNPKPIFFLTVIDTEFRFIIGIKEKDNNTIQQGEFKDKYPLETAYECMEKALREHGIGAKTSAGYGYLEEE
jgi:CRISPR-associated protein Cmr6